jgi:uncharacterized protein (TIGR02301 family)
MTVLRLLAALRAVMPPAIFAGMVVLAQPAMSVAQQEAEASRDSGQSAAEEPEAPKIRTLPPAYDDQMARLAEILGALHYLRALCDANEGQTWREQMEMMIETEQPTNERRAQLIARFNRGFRGYREIYRECTPSAAEAANRYLRQGIRLTAEIPTRFGN